MAKPDPCILIIFGASGDLAKLKLLPAIYALADEGLLPDDFALVGYSRTKMSDDEFRDRFREAVKKQHNATGDLVEKLAAKIYYQPGNYDDAEGKANGEDLRAALDGVLVTGIAPNQQKPSMGCNIKWK